jgi:deazaflavin-dependent oxidoreductase (nitroreductase family)
MNPLLKNLMKFGVRVHVWLYRQSGGKRAARMEGKPLVLLTTRGRKTGRERTVPVVCFEEGSQRVVIASMGGAPQHPAWYHNLVANPDVEVQFGADIYPARAVIVEGEERAELWKKVVSAMPRFGDYQKKTDRVIPVVRLERT